VQTTRGAIRAKKVAIVVAGRSSQVAAMAGMRLPIESHILQAFVTEGLKPVIHHVISFGMGHFYISQSDKGGLVFGGDLDFYASYAARGNLPMVEHVMEAGMTLMPMIGRAKVLRSWGGIMDMSPDGSPIIDKTHVEGLFSTAAGTTGVQGGAGVRLVHGASDGDRPAARGGRQVPAGPFRDRASSGRRRHRASTTCIEVNRNGAPCTDVGCLRRGYFQTENGNFRLNAFSVPEISRGERGTREGHAPLLPPPGRRAR
jgi:glycine/D-amino acid oxidase-like deaminating enzyme